MRSQESSTRSVERLQGISSFDIYQEEPIEGEGKIQSDSEPIVDAVPIAPIARAEYSLLTVDRQEKSISKRQALDVELAHFRLV